jgi:predicted nucleic acid-binding protein
MVIVFDSSSLILLAKIDILRIVADNYKVSIPDLVKRECTIKDNFDAKMISALINEGQIKVGKIDKPPSINTLCKDFKIHRGEAEALALALQKKCPLAVDDLPTIKACKILNHKFVTAIHFLINLVESRRINVESGLVKLEKLSYFGRYNNRIIADAVKRIGGKE